MAFKIFSKDFKHNGLMQDKFTCKGAGVNPELVFDGVPEGAKTISLIMDDPDAPRGTFVHWLVWNINPKDSILKNAVPPGSVQGTNDGGGLEYVSPCPPYGEHRYFFKAYALDTRLNLEEGSSKKQLEEAMKGHVLEKAELIGRYGR